MEDLKKALDVSANSAAGFVKNNKILTGALAGGAVGTFLIPIPIVGTLIGIWGGVKIAEKIDEEHKDKKE